MHPSRWLLVSTLALALSGCDEDVAKAPAGVPDGPAAGAAAAPAERKVDSKLLFDSTTPDPTKFQVGPDPRKPKAEKDAANATDDGKKDPTPAVADKKAADDDKKPDDKTDADKKAPDAKGDADKKAPDAKGDPDKKAADAKDADKPPSARELLSQAREAVEKDDVNKALSLLEKAVAAEPKNHEALLNLALLTQREASQLKRPKSNPLFLKSAAWMRQLRSATGKLDENEKRFLGMAVYNEACTFAVQGDAAKAMKSLEEATELGGLPLEDVKKDDELASLRKLPEYEALMKRLEEKAAVAARKQAEEARAHAKITLAENKPFKFAFELPDLDGKKVNLADLKGKVVIVDVWGTWCPPCRMEIPHFIELYKKLHEKGLEIVGINYENLPDSEAKKVIKEYVDKVKIPYRCVLGNDDVQKQIPDFEGFPTTLFIDRSGKVRAKTVGFQESMVAELEEIVTILLNEASPKS